MLIIPFYSSNYENILEESDFHSSSEEEDEENNLEDSNVNDISFSDSNDHIRIELTPASIDRDDNNNNSNFAPSVRMHNLHAVYGSQNLANLATGLRNMKNTCYINAVVQCLFKSSQLVKDLMSKSDEAVMNPSRSLSNELRFLFLVLRSGVYKSITPYDFKRRIDSLLPQFAGNGQHDAQEFLTGLLDIMESEASSSSTVSSFEGSFVSTITCLTCNQKSNPKTEPFNCLQVKVTSSVEQSIQDFQRSEKIEWRCDHPSCNSTSMSVAEKKIELAKLPDTLIIQLKRFEVGFYEEK